ncbi:MAG: hypothetical protein JJU12_06490 [Chlamydiales bacterium]|nr:hypothetical protein [Chlamydiales bacterium]
MAPSIRIAARLRPFSHLSKTSCLIPGTDLVVEAYPARIFLKDLKGNVIKEIILDIEGPLKRFTVMQDLERGCVTLFSERYRFHLLSEGRVSYAKNPGLPPLPISERLSLGSHKKQDWEAIRKRLDFREIFPLWFRLGSLLTLPERREPNEGIFSLLEACREAVDAHQPERVVPAFERLFLAGFGGLLVPRLTDDEYQGILPPDRGEATGSPLHLLSEGAALIRSLFVAASDNEIALLPNLPPEFFAGRMVNLLCPPYGELDLEWSKKTIRRLVFKAVKDSEIHFHLRSGIRRYRLRRSRQDRGEQRVIGEPLEINSGSTYLLDQFEK